MDKQPDADTNRMIQKLLSDYSLDLKTKITFVLVNFMPFRKPDSSLHSNFNPIEISNCLTSHSISLAHDLSSISDHITVYIDRIYKIFNINSNLVGMPYPESQFLRIRVNLKLQWFCFVRIGFLRLSPPPL